MRREKGRRKREKGKGKREKRRVRALSCRERGMRERVAPGVGPRRAER
jgi:hypothetical protein